jgi:hypothetical protein
MLIFMQIKIFLSNTYLRSYVLTFLRFFQPFNTKTEMVADSLS